MSIGAVICLSLQTLRRWAGGRSRHPNLESSARKFHSSPNRAPSCFVTPPPSLNRVRTTGGCLMDWKNSGGEIRSTFLARCRCARIQCAHTLPLRPEFYRRDPCAPRAIRRTTGQWERSRATPSTKAMPDPATNPGGREFPPSARAEKVQSPILTTGSARFFHPPTSAPLAPAGATGGKI